MLVVRGLARFGLLVGWLVTHVTAWLIVAMVKDTFSYYSNMYLLRFLTRIQNEMNGWMDGDFEPVDLNMLLE